MKTVVAHYMPWFTKAPYWRHWRGEGNPGLFDPEEMDAQGRRRVASLFYPLCGPYDSTDFATIDRHLRIMKYAGIQGIVVDWYGIGMDAGGVYQYADYRALHDAVITIWNVLKEHPTALKFALMFDGHSLDTVQQAMQAGKTSEAPTEYARRSLSFAAKEFFRHERYLKHPTNCGNRSLLLVFGWPKDPKTVARVQGWKAMLSDLDPSPLVLSQDTRNGVDWSDGVFYWPNPEVGGGEWRKAIQHCTGRTADEPGGVIMAVAFPGWQDVYEKDNLVNRHHIAIDRSGGSTLRATLQQGLNNKNAHYVQIATWNDWGEGTQIEPSLDFGPREIETVRQLLRPPDSGSGG